MTGRTLPAEKAEDIYLIDCLFAGLPRQCGVFLVAGERAALVDTGPSVTADIVLEGLDTLGVEKLDYIVLTHLHMDHAGAVPFLLQRSPEARVLVAERSMRFLKDPGRMVESAGRSLGRIAPHYGTLLPIAPERVAPLAEELVLELGGGKALEAFEAPGHSRGHFVFRESSSRAVFCGDCLGHYIEKPGYVYPATPAPEFDLEASLASARRLLELEPEVLLFPHFGSSRQPEHTVAAFERQLTRSVELARGLPPERRSAAELGALLFDDMPATGKATEDLMRGILEVNAGGVLHYLRRQQAGP